MKRLVVSWIVLVHGHRSALWTQEMLVPSNCRCKALFSRRLRSESGNSHFNYALSCQSSIMGIREPEPLVSI